MAEPVYVDTTSEKLATFEDLYNIQQGYLICSGGRHFNPSVYNWGARQLAPDDTPTKLVRKTDANQCGLCVNQYAPDMLTNISGINYTGYQLVQLRDLIPDWGTVQPIDGLYTFSKVINTYNVIIPGGASVGSLSGYVDLNKFLNLEIISYVLTTNSQVNYSNYTDYAWNYADDELFTFGVDFTGSSTYDIMLLLNKNLSNSTQNITLPVHLGSNGVSTNSSCTLYSGSSVQLSIGSSDLYLNVLIRSGNVTMYIFNISLKSENLADTAMITWGSLEYVRPYEISHEANKLTRT